MPRSRPHDLPASKEAVQLTWSRSNYETSLCDAQLCSWIGRPTQRYKTWKYSCERKHELVHQANWFWLRLSHKWSPIIIPHRGLASISGSWGLIWKRLLIFQRYLELCSCSIYDADRHFSLRWRRRSRDPLNHKQVQGKRHHQENPLLAKKASPVRIGDRFIN